MKTLPKGLKIYIHEGSLIADLYGTIIVQYEINNHDVILDSGLRAIGRQSAHTKKCLNFVLKPYGIHVRQKNFKWFANDRPFDSYGYCMFSMKKGEKNE